jgi:hypothetical protein
MMIHDSSFSSVSLLILSFVVSGYHAQYFQHPEANKANVAADPAKVIKYINI